MLSKEEKNKYRQELFKHLDGIAVAPIAFSLREKGVLDFILKKNIFFFLRSLKNSTQTKDT